MTTPLTGGCACGAVRIEVTGRPLRVGLCHCMTCRKAHAAAFNPFAVYPQAAVALTGEVRAWTSSSGYQRLFCPQCGSRVLALNAEEAEVSLGSFDEPGLLTPSYESWVSRREPWLTPLQGEQHARNRPLSA